MDRLDRVANRELNAWVRPIRLMALRLIRGVRKAERRPTHVENRGFCGKERDCLVEDECEMVAPNHIRYPLDRVIRPVVREVVVGQRP